MTVQTKKWYKNNTKKYIEIRDTLNKQGIWISDRGFDYSDSFRFKLRIIIIATVVQFVKSNEK